MLIEETRIMQKIMLQYYDETMKEEQEKGIFRSRYEFGKEYMLKVVDYRKKGMINKDDYDKMRNLIEELFLFY